MRELSMTARAIRMRERRRKMKIEGIESQPRNDCLCTLREVAEYWGVSTARAAQIERLALEKLRDGLEEAWEEWRDRPQCTRSSGGSSMYRGIPASEVADHAPGFAGSLDSDDESGD